MMNLPRKDGVRRIEYSGHQLYYEAYFHGWTRDSENKMVAVLEHSDGSIHLESMIYCIKFYDQETK